MKDNLTSEFLQSLNEVESILHSMLFEKHSHVDKGNVHFVQYKSGETVIEFVFGSPEFQVEILIFTSKGKYTFGDLLQIPEVATWVSKNRYVEERGRVLKNEILWFLELLKVSLPIVSQKEGS
jgi:hypothetical protein